MEEPTNGRLPFLDVLVQKLPSGDFETSAYHKETIAEVVLHFDSSHPAKTQLYQGYFRQS